MDWMRGKHGACYQCWPPLAGKQRRGKVRKQATDDAVQNEIKEMIATG